MKHSKNLNKREDRAAQIAATITTDRDELLAMASRVASDYDRAVMTTNEALFETAVITFDAILYQLNERTMFGCCAEGGPCDVIAEAIKAPPGQVPHWGQPGEFLVTTEHVRVRVEYRPRLTYFAPHFAFHVVDEERPFISPTGYQSHFLSGALTPLGVFDVAKGVINDMSALHPLELRARGTGIAVRPAWIPDEQLPGQIGFGF